MYTTEHQPEMVPCSALWAPPWIPPPWSKLPDRKSHEGRTSKNNIQSPNFQTWKDPRHRFQRIDSLWESIPSWSWFSGGGKEGPGSEVNSSFKNLHLWDQGVSIPYLIPTESPESIFPPITRPKIPAQGRLPFPHPHTQIPKWVISYSKVIKTDKNWQLG